jgi:hypothetical protein
VEIATLVVGILSLIAMIIQIIQAWPKRPSNGRHLK